MSKLTESQIEILPNHYSRTYEATYACGWRVGVGWGPYQMLQKYGDQKYHTFKTISKHNGTVRTFI